MRSGWSMPTGKQYSISIQAEESMVTLIEYFVSLLPDTSVRSSEYSVSIRLIQQCQPLNIWYAVRLINTYRQTIFSWYQSAQPIHLNKYLLSIWLIWQGHDQISNMLSGWSISIGYWIYNDVHSENILNGYLANPSAICQRCPSSGLNIWQVICL
jgi:hypothetical protein